MLSPSILTEFLYDRKFTLQSNSVFKWSLNAHTNNWHYRTHFSPCSSQINFLFLGFHQLKMWTVPQNAGGRSIAMFSCWSTLSRRVSSAWVYKPTLIKAKNESPGDQSGGCSLSLCIFHLFDILKGEDRTIQNSFSSWGPLTFFFVNTVSEFIGSFRPVSSFGCSCA